jgi:large subunit ribosomal protein L18
MKSIQFKNQLLREKRALRVRKHLRGNSIKPRMCVQKTNFHIYVQIIDDEAGVTLGATSTIAKEFKDGEFGKKNKATAKKIGERIAEIALAKNIKEVVFDRGPHKYHGILAELANGARGAGLKF